MSPILAVSLSRPARCVPARAWRTPCAAAHAWRTSRQALAALLLAVAPLTAMPRPAHADFNVCNYSGSRVGVALGYKDADGWVTEGWWNLSDRTCEALLRGGLVARYYYVYAIDYDRGGEWTGQAFMCSRDKEFTIRGIDNCLARGYDRTGFYEVDTGDQRSWTMQLTNSAKTSDVPSAATPGLPAGGAKGDRFPGGPAKR